MTEQQREKIKKLYCFARQRRTQWVPAVEKLCPSLGGFSKEFYSNGSRTGAFLVAEMVISSFSGSCWKKSFQLFRKELSH